MSKKVSAREFLHGFAKLEKGLRPGESVTVTRRGKPLGKFTKDSPTVKVKMPDFEKDACQTGLSREAGDAMLARLLRDEAIS